MMKGLRINGMLILTLILNLLGIPAAAQEQNPWKLETEENIVTEKTTLRISKEADKTNRSWAGIVFLYNPDERSQNGKPAMAGCAFIVDKRIHTSSNRLAEGIYQTKITLKIGDDLREEGANVVLKNGNLAYPDTTNCLLLQIALGDGNDIGAVIPMATGVDAQMIFHPDNFEKVYNSMK